MSPPAACWSSYGKVGTGATIRDPCCLGGKDKRGGDGSDDDKKELPKVPRPQNTIAKKVWFLFLRVWGRVGMGRLRGIDAYHVFTSAAASSREDPSGSNNGGLPYICLGEPTLIQC